MRRYQQRGGDSNRSGGADPVNGLGARAWLAAHCATVKALRLATYDIGGRDVRRGSLLAQLATVLFLLPHLEDISCMWLEPQSENAPPDQAYSNVCALLSACVSATSLELLFTWYPDPPGQLPASFPLQLFGEMTSLRSLHFSLCAGRGMVLTTVGLEGFVGVVSSLTRLHMLRLHIDVDDAVSVLPAGITALGELRTLKLGGFEQLTCAPGWADLPKLETLQIGFCGFDGGGEHAFPGISGLLSLTKLVFDHASTLTQWPSALWCLTRLRVLHHTVEMDDDDGDPPQAALPYAWSQLQGLQEVDLRGQGYHSFPAVITQLTALTKLCLLESCFEALPAGFTALASLVDLRLGHRAHGEPGNLDVRALGSLAAFPRLTELVICESAVTCSRSFVDAAHHATFKCLVLVNAFAATGMSRAAVLMYAHDAKEQGKRSAVRFICDEDKPGALEFWTWLDNEVAGDECALH